MYCFSSTPRGMNRSVFSKFRKATFPVNSLLDCWRGRWLAFLDKLGQEEQWDSGIKSNRWSVGTQRPDSGLCPRRETHGVSPRLSSAPDVPRPCLCSLGSEPEDGTRCGVMARAPSADSTGSTRRPLVGPRGGHLCSRTGWLGSRRGQQLAVKWTNKGAGVDNGI